jgi:thiosulfate dehydrogenase [quinone] large subunit
MITAFSVGLYLLLSWAFEDNLFEGRALLFTAILIGLIVVAGVLQASRLSDTPMDTQTASPSSDLNTPGQTDDPRLWKLLMGNAYWAILWLPLRFFVGRAWVAAGEHKVRDDAWMSGGTALQGYWTRVTAIPEQGNPPIVFGWYRDFLKYMLDNEWYTWMAKAVAIGEVLVGIALIVGALVGIAAFFGTVMNFNFMLAGSASTNPVLFGLGVFLVLGWKVAGYWGLDRVLLPALGAPWKAGELFTRTEKTDIPLAAGQQGHA